MATKTIFAFDDLGNKVPIGNYEYTSPRYHIGGKIFYIDSTADGTYTFKNAQGQTVAAPSVGDDCTGWTYTVSGANKDKYYVYNSSAIFDRSAIDYSSIICDNLEEVGDTPVNYGNISTKPSLTWAYLDTTNQSYLDNDYYDSYHSSPPSGKQEWEYYGAGGRVFEHLDNIAMGTSIGTGKSNTINMLTLRNGVYNQGSQENPTVGPSPMKAFSETIWYVCDQFNKGTYVSDEVSIANNTNCSDWYIPSKDELDALKSHIGASTFANIFSSLNVVEIFTSSAYPSNSDIDNSEVFLYAWAFLKRQNTDYGFGAMWRWPVTQEYLSLVLIRSF